MISPLERNDWLAGIERELHDLCQPVTILQCRLEVAQMSDDVAGMREALEGGLDETRRIFAAIDRIRESLHGGSIVRRDSQWTKETATGSPIAGPSNGD